MPVRHDAAGKKLEEFRPNRYRKMFYRWKKVYGGLALSYLLMRMNCEAQQNAKLKRLVAALPLDKMMLQDAP